MALGHEIPDSAGVGRMLGNQREARECYNASVTKAKKGTSKSTPPDRLQMAIDTQAQSGDEVTK